MGRPWTGTLGLLVVVGLCLSGSVFATSTAGVAGTPTAGVVTNSHGVQQSAPPITLSVRVAGTAVADGGEVTTTNNPRLSIALDSASTIEIVAVRVDGGARRSYVPNATTFTGNTTLDLDAGSHELSIVVRTAAGTTTYAATIIEDSSAPLLTFESPISAGFVGPNGTYEQLSDSYTLNTSSVELVARLHDRSAVERVLIETGYRYQYGGQPQSENHRIEIVNPNQTITRELRLGPYQSDIGNGTNTLRIELRDEFGHIRTYETSLRVEDTAPPNISVLTQTPVATRSAIRIDAQARDSVGLASVGFRRGSANDAGQQYLFTERQPTQQPLTKTVQPTVNVYDGTRNITLIATDQAGKTTTKQLRVNYTDLVTPTIRFTRSTSGSIGPKTVRVTGEVLDGQITRVRVETLTADGDIIDINSVYSGGITENVSFSERLTTGVYPATVRVRVVDTTGTEHTKTIEISQSEAVQTEAAQTEAATTMTPFTVSSQPPLPPTETTQSSLSHTVLSLITGHTLPVILGVFVTGFAAVRYLRN